MSPTFPAAIDALVSALSAEIPGLVHDGADLEAAGQEAVFVGSDEEGAVAQGSFSGNGLAVVPDRESYVIRCSVMVLNGAGDVRSSRNRAVELYTTAAGVLAADKTLGGVVMSASPGEWSFVTEQTESGVVATLTFNVDIDAFTQL